MRSAAYKPRLVARVKRLLRERTEPAGDPEGKLDAGEELETALEAAAEFVKLAEERDVLIAQHRKWQREHIRTGSA